MSLAKAKGGIFKSDLTPAVTSSWAESGQGEPLEPAKIDGPRLHPRDGLLCLEAGQWRREMDLQELGEPESDPITRLKALFGG